MCVLQLCLPMLCVLVQVRNHSLGWQGIALLLTEVHFIYTKRLTACPVIRPFWRDINAQNKHILGLDVPFSPLHFLLHIPPLPVSQNKRSTLTHLLNAAKFLLPIYKSVLVYQASRNGYGGCMRLRQQSNGWQPAGAQGDVSNLSMHCG